MVEFSYPVDYRQIDNGDFEVVFSGIPEIVTVGRSIEEAREMAQDALHRHLQGWKNRVSHFHLTIPRVGQKAFPFEQYRPPASVFYLFLGGKIDLARCFRLTWETA